MTENKKLVKEVVYNGTDKAIFKVNEYEIVYNKNMMQCDCAVKHNRNWKIPCIHVKFLLGLVDENRNKTLK